MKMLVVFVVLLHVSLHVLADPMFEGDHFILLPCQFHTFELENPTVVWLRQDLSPSTVHQRQAEEDQLKDQNQLYVGRTSMRVDALVSGDLSLNLTNLHLSDSGTYTCSVRDFREERIVTEVELLVKRHFQTWIIAPLVVLVLIVAAGVLFHYRQHFMSVYQVEVSYGVQSVSLPCKTFRLLPKDVKVEWTIKDNIKVHVQNGSVLVGQDEFYKNRTEMKNIIKSGDLSLTLKHPTDEDTGTYTCKVSKDRDVLVLKQVKVSVRVR